MTEIEFTHEGITYVTVPEKCNSSCRDCHADILESSHLCGEFLGQVDCAGKGIIWIKKEDSVKATEEITFNPAQIKYISEVFGIDASEDVLKVSDGFVRKSSMVWWKQEFGPEHTKASEHWDNIKGYPDAYSIKEPKYKVVYE